MGKKNTPYETTDILSGKKYTRYPDKPKKRRQSTRERKRPGKRDRAQIRAARVIQKSARRFLERKAAKRVVMQKGLPVEMGFEIGSYM